jgi:orotate phosphoribosyltransferase-like protein
MDININININDGKKLSIDLSKIMGLLTKLVASQEAPKEAPIVVTKSLPQVEEIKPSTVPQPEGNATAIDLPAKIEKKVSEKKPEKRHIFKMVKRITSQHVEDMLAAAEILDDAYQGKISYLSFAAKIAKTSGIPLGTIRSVSRSIGDKFDFQFYHRQRHENTTEGSKDAAKLLYCGMTVGVAQILTEQNLTGAEFNYVVKLASHGFEQSELDDVCKKYQKELAVYGVTELKHREDWLEALTNNRSMSRQSQMLRHIKYTPDQVGRLVFAYEDAITDGLTGQRAVYAASKKVGLSGCLSTLRRALFDHKGVPGFQHIKTPVEVRSNTDVRSATKLDDVRTVKFLYNQRSMTHEQIARELGMSKQTVGRICSGLTYSQVVVDADTERRLEAQYPVHPTA